MSVLKNSVSHLIETIKGNALEIWATLSIFVGLPVVALLYLDWKAAVAVFVVASCIIGTLAVRNK